MNEFKMSNSSEVLSDFNSKMWSNFLEHVMQIDNPYYLSIYVTVMLSIFFISLLGNLMTCFVIYMEKSMHTATNYYLFNLAAADLMLTLSLLTEIYSRVIYTNSKVMCLIQWFSVGCLWNNCILTMTVLAVERYIAVWHPLMLKSTCVLRRVTKIIVILWVVSILESLPELLVVDVIKTRHAAVCFLTSSYLTRILNGVLAILSFFLPLIIMTFVYSTIVFKVNTRQKKQSMHRIFNFKDPRRKINWLMLAMTVTFFFCWLPFNTIRILICVLDTQQLVSLGKGWCLVFQAVNINSWLSSVMNPVLFSLMSTKFRKSLKTLWNTKITRIRNGISNMNGINI